MNARALLPIGLLILAVIASMSFFTVDERELAIKFRLGKIIQTEFEPGLHFKMPFINNVRKYPRQILTQTNPQELFLTFEKKNLFVDFFVKWRIIDVGAFYRATRGDEALAAQRLIEIVKDGVRSEFAKRTVPQVVTAERRELLCVADPGELKQLGRVDRATAEDHLACGVDHAMATGDGDLDARRPPALQPWGRAAGAVAHVGEDRLDDRCSLEDLAGRCGEERGGSFRPLGVALEGIDLLQP